MLIAEPYSLTWADPVYAKLSATNIYGTSVLSQAGNGAILHTVPDAPTDLTEVLDQRTATTLGFIWETSFVGGTPIIDYTIESDQGLDTYITIASGVTNKAMLVSDLTFEVTYKFRVTARNAFGSSEPSQPLELLCATKPLQPEAPTTQVVNADMIVQWVEPSTQGTPIFGYKVFIRAADQSFIEESTACQGYTEAVYSAQQCVIPLSVLTSPPFSLLLSNHIWAKVQAENFYGLSPVSESGNGGLLQLVPDAPVNLVENIEVTSRTIIEFSWQDGASNGGASVIDY